ncbi:MAG TPA: nucleoside recognition domain-containing protein [Acidobacteriota bacterium]|nr:nucleoside recognition domain-containing protein [Acidobacteriota bacterium]
MKPEYNNHTLATLRTGVKKGLATYWMLMKIMIPVYIVVAALQHTPVLPAVARFFEPAMGVWHLPGDAALAMVLGHVVNLYAAVAVIAAGHWNPVAVTIAGVILGVSHNHLMEGAILKKMRAPALVLIVMRIVIGWSLGWLVAVLIN